MQWVGVGLGSLRFALKLGRQVSARTRVCNIMVMIDCFTRVLTITLDGVLTVVVFLRTYHKQNSQKISLYYVCNNFLLT